MLSFANLSPSDNEYANRAGNGNAKEQADSQPTLQRISQDAPFSRPWVFCYLGNTRGSLKELSELIEVSDLESRLWRRVEEMGKVTPVWIESNISQRHFSDSFSMLIEVPD